MVESLNMHLFDTIYTTHCFFFIQFNSVNYRSLGGWNTRSEVSTSASKQISRHSRRQNYASIVSCNLTNFRQLLRFQRKVHCAVGYLIWWFLGECACCCWGGRWPSGRGPCMSPTRGATNCVQVGTQLNFKRLSPKRLDWSTPQF